MTSRDGTVKPRPIGKWRGPRPALAVAALLASACAVHGALFRAGDGVDEMVEPVLLHTRQVELHLARRPGGPAAPLILYVTGDGGWRGADPLLFRALVQWGYPTVGMEARDYLDHLGRLDRRPTARHLAADYERVLRHARRRLVLAANVPVVLVGFSRGAGLAVLAATQTSLRSRLLGVVAVALTDEEDEVSLETGPEATNPYRLLPRLGALPVAVIQSTHDHYLAAAEARPLFGPDSPARRLVAIDSDGHTFGGARDKLLESLRSCLRWIAGTPP